MLDCMCISKKIMSKYWPDFPGERTRTWTWTAAACTAASLVVRPSASIRPSASVHLLCMEGGRERYCLYAECF